MTAIKLLITVPLVFLLSSNELLIAQETVQNNKTQEIFNAIRSGSISDLKEKVNSAGDANSISEGYSALMAASLSGTAEQMKLLIEKGANVNYKNEDGLTALWFAAPDLNKTMLLLNYGADVNTISKEGYSILDKLAALPGSLNCMKLLVSKGASLNEKHVDNLLLYNAAGSCDTSILGYLIRSKLNVNDSIAAGDYPINSALNYRCFLNLKMLVENGANVNIHPMHQILDLFNGVTPLMYAATGNDKLSFYYLLEHGADPNAKSKDGRTVLMFLEQGQWDCADMTQALINHGAKVNEKAPDGTDALFYAMKKGNTESVAILKKYMNLTNQK